MLCPHTLFAARLTPSPARCAECAHVQQCDYNVRYETHAPTAVSDRECDPRRECESHEYEVSEGTYNVNRVCANLTTCHPVDEYERTPPMPSSSGDFLISDRVCRDREVCIPGEQFEFEPPAFDSDRDCRDISECSYNLVQSVAPTATSDRECKGDLRAW